MAASRHPFYDLYEGDEHRLMVSFAQMSTPHSEVSELSEKAPRTVLPHLKDRVLVILRTPK